jgi:hypothetical protein
MAALVKISFGLLILLSATRFLTAQEHLKISDHIETRSSIFENPLLRKMEDEKKKVKGSENISRPKEKFCFKRAGIIHAFE